jgi:aminopeptidase YwaD
MKQFYLLLFSILLNAVMPFGKSQDISFDNPANTISSNELHEHISYFSSDSLKGRRTGTQEFNLAVDYAMGSFLKSGLKPINTNSILGKSMIQSVNFLKYTFDTLNTILEVTSSGKNDTLHAGNGFFFNKPGKIETTSIEGPVAFIGYGIYEPKYGWNDYKNVDVKGKWVIYILDIPDSITNKFPNAVAFNYTSRPERTNIRTQAAMAAGALGIITLLPIEAFKIWDIMADYYNDYIITELYDEPWLRYNCPNLVIDSTSIINIFKNEPFDPLLLKGNYSSFILNNLKIKLRKKYSFDIIKGQNVLAIVEGSDSVKKKELITVGAHLDHLGIIADSIMNGADDNASGCAAILEIANAVARSNPKRSVLFILYCAEELNMLGSWNFINSFPTSEFRILTNINLDMIGRPDGDANELGVQNTNYLPDRLKQIINETNNKTERLKLDFEYFPNPNGSDHYSFIVKGIPAFLFHSGIHSDYHKSTDDSDKIDFIFLRNVSRLTYHIVMELANSETGYN